MRDISRLRRTQPQSLERGCDHERKRLALKIEIGMAFLDNALEDEQRENRHREPARAADAESTLNVEQPDHEIRYLKVSRR